MTVQVQAAAAGAIAMIITFWTGTLYVIYGMISTSLSAQIFIYSLAAIGLVAAYNLAKTGGRKAIQ